MISTGRRRCACSVAADSGCVNGAGERGRCAYSRSRSSRHADTNLHNRGNVQCLAPPLDDGMHCSGQVPQACKGDKERSSSAAAAPVIYGPQQPLAVAVPAMGLPTRTGSKRVAAAAGQLHKGRATHVLPVRPLQQPLEHLKRGQEEGSSLWHGAHAGSGMMCSDGSGYQARRKLPPLSKQMRQQRPTSCVVPSPPMAAMASTLPGEMACTSCVACARACVRSGKVQRLRCRITWCTTTPCNTAHTASACAMCMAGGSVRELST